MALTPYNPYRKGNWLTVYENQCFIARNSTAKTHLLGDSIVKGLNRYKGTWYKYFPNNFNFGISGVHAENILWRALQLPEMSYLKNVIILCGTNNICTDSPYDIAQCLLDIGVYFQNHSSKIKIFISGILPRDACHSLNSMLIKEINTILKCKCALHSFNFVEEEQGWTDNINTLDPSLFYHDKLYVIQKAIRNIKLSESIITATEDRNIGQNTHFNKMSNKKHNQFIKTYKMAASFKLNHADFPPLLNSTVSKPVSYVSSLLSFTTVSRSFSNKVRAISY